MTVNLFESFFTRMLKEMHTSMKKDPKYMKYDLDDLESCQVLFRDALAQLKKIEAEVVLVSTDGVEVNISLTEQAKSIVHKAVRLGLHKEPENGIYIVDDNDLDSIRGNKYLTGRV